MVAVDVGGCTAALAGNRCGFIVALKCLHVACVCVLCCRQFVFVACGCGCVVSAWRVVKVVASS